MYDDGSGFRFSLFFRLSLLLFDVLCPSAVFGELDFGYVGLRFRADFDEIIVDHQLAKNFL